MWMLPWNCRTALTISLFINLARQYHPFLSIPTNILNPMSWLTTRVGDINPMHWPVQPQYINPIFDQSRFEIFTSRWTDFHTSSADMLDDAVGEHHVERAVGKRQCAGVAGHAGES